MKIKFSTADKIIFTVIAVLAAAVVALVLFGCDGPAVDADGGADAATEDGGVDTDTADAGPDSGALSLARCPKPNDCTTEAACLELGQTVLPEFFCANDGEVCCHVTM